MRKDNKKALYESIMTSVAKEVKKVLNEDANFLYDKKQEREFEKVIETFTQLIHGHKSNLSNYYDDQWIYADIDFYGFKGLCPPKDHPKYKKPNWRHGIFWYNIETKECKVLYRQDIISANNINELAQKLNKIQDMIEYPGDNDHWDDDEYNDTH